MANEPLQTPLVNKFFSMDIDPNQVSNRQLNFNQAIEEVQE
jgi:hypothetical protein